MKAIIGALIKKYFQLRAFKLKNWKTEALKTQELLLQELVSRAQQTEFGKLHNFSKIENIQQYQELVPVRSYEEISPFIERMIQGEDNILWPTRISFFSKSSGTTNDISKYIPVSQEVLNDNNYQAGRDLYSFFYLNHPESKILSSGGSVLGLSGSLIENEKGIKIGDVSAIIISQLPYLVRQLRQPSSETSLLSSWEEKIPRMIGDSIDKNITHLSGVPTWFVSLFEEMKKEHPFKDLRDVWPNLELFVHGAVAFEPYRPIFEKLIPYEDMKYMEVYNASEGFFAIQDDLSLRGEMLLLTDHGIFYEFIAFDEYQKGGRKAIGLSEVRVGIDYAMIISTNAGLWRYDLGDLIQFTSIDPYRIKITGRTKQFINICGEELMVGNTDQAIALVAEKLDTIIEHYTVAPIFMNEQGKAGHEWIIEFNKAPKDISEFASKLDLTLQELNSDYQAKRQNDIAFQELVLHVVASGTFMKWLESRGKLGGQHKVPKLSQHRKVLEDILNI